ncbi:hypothetical protein BO94DRAFT_343724 [Aspergillus sclerotioniger CBS 115572]|uniref:Transmembrane protein n=1 Tax=Aspergillus sclerotioniger CBS 115572 TaxID=1450535 RepID=A0A317XAC0_9EURO|nr:hypothetical protein BO94DRAFT_343724 [Aspergillus sclerotioniger CBS 115572]PWY93470.1 hypothetical protein BO94DRAFT_343724 [Aspergillus sclerotioniger CBS 115572]
MARTEPIEMECVTQHLTFAGSPMILGNSISDISDSTGNLNSSDSTGNSDSNDSTGNSDRASNRSTSSNRSNNNRLDTQETRLESAMLYQISSMNRFYTRTIVLVFIPPLVAAYFVVIWLVLLRKGADPAVKFASISELWVFYSWFVICTFGIGWSKYGLAGVEVAMLQSRLVDKKTLYMHSGNSWSGPDGWISCLGRLLRGKESQVHRLWYFLSALSLLPFVALPISGLCMELSDGYIFSSSAPWVIGRQWDNFNNRQLDQISSRARSRWETGASAVLPGIGILHTPPHTRREKFNGLRNLPNIFPLDELPSEFFISPQARTPFDGSAWGLRIEYNCSIVRDASEFTIISDRSNIIKQPTSNNITERDVIVNAGSQGNVYVSNSRSGDSTRSHNLFAYIEMGVSNSSNQPPAYDGAELETVNILELALWQMRTQSGYEEETQGFPFDEGIDVPLKGMGQPFIQLPNGTFTNNETFFEAYNTSDALDDFASPDKKILYLAPPIGLRCNRLSTLGFAELAVKASTYHNFTRTQPPDFDIGREEGRTPIFGYTTRDILRYQYLMYFDSINLPPPRTVSNSVYYTRFLQAVSRILIPTRT